MAHRRERNHFIGCVIGGAVGDALGWPISHLPFKEIAEQYGAKGLRELEKKEKPYAVFSSNTQMALFTAEGLLRDQAQLHGMGIATTATCLRYAYARWLHTQGLISNMQLPEAYLIGGWLASVPALRARRCTYTTDLSALMSTRMGTVERPINRIATPSCLARCAAIGLMKPPKEAFALSCTAAAMTHGHPTAYLSAGTFGMILSWLVEGYELREAIHRSLEHLKTQEGHEAALQTLKIALALAENGQSDNLTDVESMDSCRADGALGVALYAALRHDQKPADALRCAVNHSGDSHTTGALCGNLVGLILGELALPMRMRYGVECYDVLKQMAMDVFLGYRTEPPLMSRYPAY